MEPQKILVTDGETRATLAAVRSLGRAGYVVDVCASRDRPLAGASRYARRTHRLPDPGADPKVFGQAFRSLVDREGFDLVLPIAEVTLASLYAMKGLDPATIVAPRAEAFDRAVDKHGILDEARAVGLDVPRGVLIESVSRLERLPDGFTYPVVLKARRSRFLTRDGWCNGGVAILEDAGDLAKARQDPGFAAGALLQEFLEGHGEAVFLLMSEGRVHASFAHRRLREKPPSGGVSVLRESIAPDPALLEGSQKLLERLGWSGVAMVEFRRTPTGRAALMEINPRLWGSLQLAIDAGVDFPALLVEQHRGSPRMAPAARLHVRCRWLLGDLDHLLICLRRPAMRRATGRGPGRVCADFLRSFFDGSKLEVLRFGDPRPFLRECTQWREN